MENIEITRMANGWAVTPTRGPLNDYRCYDSRGCFVFNDWKDLVRHIKKELALPKDEKA